MQLDKPLRILIPALIVLAILLALLVPWRCSAQTVGTAGTIPLSIDYTAQQDADMTAEHGEGWKDWLSGRLQEAARNHLGTATERAVRRDAALLRSSEIRSQEREAVDRVIDSARTREARKRQVPDTGRVIDEPIQTRGDLRIEADGNRTATQQLAGLGIGKMLSPRMEITGGWIDAGGGGGGIPTSSRHGGESEFMTTLAVAGVVGVAIIILIVYGIVRLVS